MKSFNNLPLYVLDVAPKSAQGVSVVAFVDKPAIQRGFLAFADQEHPAYQLRLLTVDDTNGEPSTITVTSEDRRIISGPLMLADTPIFRAPPQTPEKCYVQFPATAIYASVMKFFAEGFQSNVNLQHDATKSVQDVVMFESFITDKSRGILPMAGYEDSPDGSWFGSFVVNNDDVWQQVKDGKITGFSIEGIFSELGTEEQSPEVDGWWNDPDLDFTAEERKVLDGLWDVVKDF